MSVFCPIVYFFPGCSSFDALPECGREFTGSDSHCFNVRGPGDMPGLLVSKERAHGGVRYCKESQKWRKRGSYWIGTERRFHSSAFLRSKAIRGDVVEFGGSEWIIPRANPVTMTCTLERVLDIDDDGKWFETVHAEYAELSSFALSIAADLMDSMSGGGEPALPADDMQEVLAIACRILRVNYDLTDVEIAALGILSERSYFEIMTVFCDLLEYARFTVEAGTETEPPFVM